MSFISLLRVLFWETEKADFLGKRHITYASLTLSDQDMSVKITFCREFLEHLDLTLANETFRVISLDYYLRIEQKGHSEKGHPTDF